MDLADQGREAGGHLDECVAEPVAVGRGLDSRGQIASGNVLGTRREPFEIPHHRLKGGRDLADLVVTAAADRLIDMSVRDRFGSPRQLPHSGHDHARHRGDEIDGEQQTESGDQKALLELPVDARRAVMHESPQHFRVRVVERGGGDGHRLPGSHS